jgi:hypothetical protein
MVFPEKLLFYRGDGFFAASKDANTDAGTSSTICQGDRQESLVSVIK